MRKEAKAKKAVNAKATKDALLKRRLEQAKQFEGYKVPKPSANSGMCSQEELPYEDVSEDRAVHGQQDKDYPSQFNKDKARHTYKLPASRTAVPNQTRTKESQKRKKKLHEVQSENDREEKRVKTTDISSDARGKKAVNKKATKGAQWRKSLEIATSEVHSQEVLSNDDTSDVESICSLPRNQHDDCSLVHVDDYYATSDDEDETVSDELHSSPLKELFQKGASSSSTPSRKRPASDASSKKKQGQLPRSCGCQESIFLREEIKKMKYKVEELQRKLNESSLLTESDKKPLAGVISPVLAVKYKMEEMTVGSGIFWNPSQRLNALAEGKTIGTMTSYLLDVMFDKEKLSISNLKGGGHCGYQQLCPKIVGAITAFVQSQFADSKVSIVSKAIQDKCTASRRGVSKRKIQES
ncbi:uncharacterized protein [Montipora foliosa]|uniref:uncharacterized protein n=1 Tax=Montipora foliosa TaxID=591990 RepID=UPI0035F1AB39